MERRGPWVGGPQMYGIPKFVVDYGLDPVLPTEGSVLDRRYEIWE